MHAFAIVALEYLLAALCAAYAWSQGDRGERLGAVWFGVNILGTVAASLLGVRSPTSHLIEDGIFAVGVLPLAVLFVSYWIGLVTLVAAALFTLEAVYLMNDLSIDTTYAWVNNLLWMSVPVIFLVSGLSNQLRRNRALEPPNALPALG